MKIHKVCKSGSEALEAARHHRGKVFVFNGFHDGAEMAIIRPAGNKPFETYRKTIAGFVLV